ncbi:hypothetical protein M513_07351 [Trichuris suis]|uniref:Uncharacterized protein n=1 Tax=Trichuris suis TaxID=68888 RepID=A0A085M3M8_9BILA|nr:hypothetical protein M513_07351 [Trichuris suis]
MAIRKWSKQIAAAMFNVVVVVEVAVHMAFVVHAVVVAHVGVANLVAVHVAAAQMVQTPLILKRGNFKHGNSPQEYMIIENRFLRSNAMLYPTDVQKCFCLLKRTSGCTVRQFIHFIWATHQCSISGDKSDSEENSSVHTYGVKYKRESTLVSVCDKKTWREENENISFWATASKLTGYGKEALTVGLQILAAPIR